MEVKNTVNHHIFELYRVKITVHYVYKLYIDLNDTSNYLLMISINDLHTNTIIQQRYGPIASTIFDMIDDGMLIGSF